jgi:hypothetical protein
MTRKIDLANSKNEEKRQYYLKRYFNIKGTITPYTGYSDLDIDSLLGTVSDKMPTSIFSDNVPKEKYNIDNYFRLASGFGHVLNDSEIQIAPAKIYLGKNIDFYTSFLNRTYNVIPMKASLTNPETNEDEVVVYPFSSVAYLNRFHFNEIILTNTTLEFPNPEFTFRHLIYDNISHTVHPDLSLGFDYSKTNDMNLRLIYPRMIQAFDCSVIFIIGGYQYCRISPISHVPVFGLLHKAVIAVYSLYDLQNLEEDSENQT